MTTETKGKRSQRRVVVAFGGMTAVMLSALAVAVLGDVAVGALLGSLVVAAALSLHQQRRYARRSTSDAAAIARSLRATDQGLSEIAEKVAVQSEELTRLAKTAAQWSKEARETEIETGIAALNRYVALGSDESVHRA
jgi:hypothetical protein